MKKRLYIETFKDQYNDVKITIDWYFHHRDFKYKAFSFSWGIFSYSGYVTFVYKNPDEYSKRHEFTV
jgi:hypothetical protein